MVVIGGRGRNAASRARCVRHPTGRMLRQGCSWVAVGKRNRAMAAEGRRTSVHRQEHAVRLRFPAIRPKSLPCVPRPPNRPLPRRFRSTRQHKHSPALHLLVFYPPHFSLLHLPSRAPSEMLDDYRCTVLTLQQELRLEAAPVLSTIKHRLWEYMVSSATWGRKWRSGEQGRGRALCGE